MNTKTTTNVNGFTTEVKLTRNHPDFVPLEGVLRDLGFRFKRIAYQVECAEKKFKKVGPGKTDESARARWLYDGLLREFNDVMTDERYNDWSPIDDPVRYDNISSLKDFVCRYIHEYRDTLDKCEGIKPRWGYTPES